MVTNVGGDDRNRTCNPVKGHSFPTSFLTIRIVSKMAESIGIEPMVAMTPRQVSNLLL